MEIFGISDRITATSAAKISKTVIKSQILLARSNVISVKVGQHVNLLFISIYVELSCKKSVRVRTLH